MENLNAEEIKCGLEHCTATGYKCEECPYFYKSEGLKSSMEILMTDALALITSQEQRIKELTVENERLRADTIDEFVKMVKEKMREVATGKRTSLIGTGWIDEIARELKGE